MHEAPRSGMGAKEPDNARVIIDERLDPILNMLPRGDAQDGTEKQAKRFADWLDLEIEA